MFLEMFCGIPFSNSNVRTLFGTLGLTTANGDSCSEPNSSNITNISPGRKSPRIAALSTKYSEWTTIRMEFEEMAAALRDDSLPPLTRLNFRSPPFVILCSTTVDAASEADFLPDKPFKNDRNGVDRFSFGLLVTGWCSSTSTVCRCSLFVAGSPTWIKIKKIKNGYCNCCWNTSDFYKSDFDQSNFQNRTLNENQTNQIAMQHYFIRLQWFLSKFSCSKKDAKSRKLS